MALAGRERQEVTRTSHFVVGKAEVSIHFDAVVHGISKAVRHDLCKEPRGRDVRLPLHTKKNKNKSMGSRAVLT